MRRVCGEPVQARHTAWSSRSRLDLANTLVVMSLLFGFRAPCCCCCSSLIPRDEPSFMLVFEL